MDDDIRALASARVEIEQLEAKLRKAKAALAVSPLVVKCAQLKKRIGDMEEIRCDLIFAIKRAAREAFEAVGIEHPHLAVTVSQRETPKSFAKVGLEFGPRIIIDDDLSAYLNREEEGETADTISP